MIRALVRVAGGLLAILGALGWILLVLSDGVSPSDRLALGSLVLAVVGFAAFWAGAMAVPNRRGGPAAGAEAVAQLPDDMIADKYPRQVVGESFYQDALEIVAGARSTEVLRTEIAAVLYLDNANEHDPNAVAVLIDDRKVGHLSRSDAERFRIIVERRALQGRSFSCPARLTGGWDRGADDIGSIGVELALSFAGQPSVRTLK